MAAQGLLLHLLLFRASGTRHEPATGALPPGAHRSGAGIPGALLGPLGLPGAPLGSPMAMMGAQEIPGMTISFGSDPMGGADDGGVMTIGGVLGGPDVIDLGDLESILGGHTGTHGHIPGQPSHGSADPFMGDIMSAMDSALMSQILPLSHRHREAPPCQQDEEKLCPRSVFKSALQCLGKYADQVSEKCKKDVKGSLPFNCANELSEGCDGVDESIISCLSNRMNAKKGKPITDACRGSLEVTQSLLHKVNTMSSTVTSTTALNDTHVTQTKTTRTKDAASAPWTCPDGFIRDGTQETASNGKSCCAAANSLVYPRVQCVTSGGRWKLVDKGGPHGGFQCCSTDVKTVSKTKKHVLPKKKLFKHLSTPLDSQSAHEISAKSLLAIVALSIMFGAGIRAVAPATSTVYAAAHRIGVPTAMLRQSQWKVNKDVYAMSPVVEQEKYGTV